MNKWEEMPWGPFFAWRPVYLDTTGCWAWWRWVRRKCINPMSYGPFLYDYSELSDQ